VWAGAIGLAAAAGAARAADDPRRVVEVGPAIFQAPAAEKIAPRQSDLSLAAPRLPDSARHALGSLTAAERAELLAPDQRPGPAHRKRPAVKVGISRPLPEPVGFGGLPAELRPGESRPASGGLLERAADGSLAWTASFSSTGAGGLRLYLRQARLPAGSRVYVYGDDGEIQGPYSFSAGTRPEGFWTNTIFSDRIFLEVQFPAALTPAQLSRAALSVGGVVHLEHPNFAPPSGEKASPAARPKSQTCFIDRSCVTTAEFRNVDQATRAVAQLNFVDPTDGKSYICTGGLMNSTAGSSVPYLLTANHCFSTQASATSLEAFWQYRTATCNGPIPPENQFPRTLQSTLLATAAAPASSDFTLVQLMENPPTDSVLLGWTTADVVHADGLVLYRLSYANGDPMIFTREQITATPSPAVCSDLPQGVFLYEKDIQGGTGGGSSGSPACLEDLRVVGQEVGSCGTNTDDYCDAVNNSSVDGAFQVTFPSVQQWLAPGSPGPCVANATTLCLNNARFRVTVFYATGDGASGVGMGFPLTGDSGYFWFFNPENIELVVKVLSACSLDGHFWVFAGGLTNVGVTLLVEDTVTGASQVYTNPVGTAFEPLQETKAFSCP
jgi:lysyl endopeptidase